MKRKVITGFVGLLFALGLAGCGLMNSPHHMKMNDKTQSTSAGNGSQAQHAVALAQANWEVANFDYTDENQQPFGLKDLKGRVWLADMIFTHCQSICPVTTAHMSKLQSKMEKLGLKIPIVSFSVDPKRDTPKVMKAYGKKFGADFSTWHFLTGYSPEQIKQFASASFKSPIQKIANTNQFTHSSSFFLINQEGKIMARYDGLEPPYSRIIQDVKKLKQTDGKAIVTQTDAVAVSARAQQPPQVSMRWNPSAAKAGKPVTLKAVITVNGKRTKSSGNVMFKFTKKGSDTSSQAMGMSQGAGVYTVQHTFKSPGTYSIMVMVTVNGQTTMPTKQITVK